MRKAQSTLEYVMGIAIVVAGLLAMQIYIKRAVEGNLKVSADNIGGQYAPKHTTSEINTTNTSHTQTTTETNTAEDDLLETIVTVTTDYDTTTQEGTENLGVFEAGLFE